MDKDQYMECFIAFLDILGFKEIVKSHSCQDILSMYHNIKNPIKKIYIGDENNKAQEIETMRLVKSKVMSDSICFYVESDLPDALFCLLICCSSFQARLASLPTPVLVRGGITSGKLYIDGDVVFGPGLVEAYLLEEKSAKYPRIIIRKGSLDVEIEKNKKNNNLSRAVHLLVFEDFDAFYSLNYYNLLDSFGETTLSYNNLMKVIKQKLSTEIDDSIRQKYLYMKKNAEQYYHQI